MPAEDSRRRVNRTGTPNSHGQLRARKAVTQKHRASSIMFGSRQQGHQGRFAGFELGSFGGSKPWPGRSGTPPVPRPPNCTGAARARSRDHATSKPGGDGKEREREKAACPAVGVPVTTRTRRVLDTTPCCPPALHARAVLPTHRPGSRAARTRPRLAPAPAARASPHPSTPPGLPVNPPPHARTSARAAKLDDSSPSSPIIGSFCRSVGTFSFSNLAGSMRL